MQLGSSGDGFLCVINPVDLPASTKVTYTTPSGERKGFPIAMDGISFVGKDARLLPLSLDLSGGLTLRHSTWELIGRQRENGGWELRFSNPGAGAGEVAFDADRPLKVEVSGGRVLPGTNEKEGTTVVVVEPQDDVVMLRLESARTD
jgi:hypothetical protein